MMSGVGAGTVEVVEGGAGDVVTGDVVTGDVVTGDVVTGGASVVVGSESDDEPEHADSTRMPIADTTTGRYLLIVATYEVPSGISMVNSTIPSTSPRVAESSP